LSLPAGASAGFKGGWIAHLLDYPSEMAQNFWTAIYAFAGCLIATALISLATSAPDEHKLKGLVYSLTERPAHTGNHWYEEPAYLGGAVIAAVIVLNLLFW
jgi:SSS family solute:Na+ symporter